VIGCDAGVMRVVRHTWVLKLGFFFGSGDVGFSLDGNGIFWYCSGDISGSIVLGAFQRFLEFRGRHFSG
jgi:hypothetical protein